MGNGFEGKSGSRKLSERGTEAWLKGKEKSSAGCTNWNVNRTESALLLAEEAVACSGGHMDPQGGHSLCCQGVYTPARNKETQQIISTGVGNSPGKREQSTDLDIRPLHSKLCSPTY